MATVGDRGSPTALEQMLARTERQLEQERERSGWLLALLERHGSALARIEARCTAIEVSLDSRLTPTQWVKILTGLLLPLGVLVITGNVELARQLVLLP